MADEPEQHPGVVLTSTNPAMLPLLKANLDFLAARETSAQENFLLSAAVTRIVGQFGGPFIGPAEVPNEMAARAQQAALQTAANLENEARLAGRRADLAGQQANEASRYLRQYYREALPLQQPAALPYPYPLTQFQRDINNAAAQAAYDAAAATDRLAQVAQREFAARMLEVRRLRAAQRTLGADAATMRQVAAVPPGTVQQSLLQRLNTTRTKALLAQVGSGVTLVKTGKEYFKAVGATEDQYLALNELEARSGVPLDQRTTIPGVFNSVRLAREQEAELRRQAATAADFQPAIQSGNDQLLSAIYQGVTGAPPTQPTGADVRAELDRRFGPVNQTPPATPADLLAVRQQIDALQAPVPAPGIAVPVVHVLLQNGMDP